MDLFVSLCSQGGRTVAGETGVKIPTILLERNETSHVLHVHGLVLLCMPSGSPSRTLSLLLSCPALSCWCAGVYLPALCTANSTVLGGVASRLCTFQMFSVQD